ncbi:MAG: hypothetical protein HY677_05445, partial [Chloroflexi bacterium]|nr:hypothetical protein [Chloroflexota bacterium]
MRETRSFEAIEEDLRRYPESLLRQFHSGKELMVGILPAEELRVWTEEGLSLAQESFRSWEAAAAYFQVSPILLETAGFADVLRWVHLARELAVGSYTIAEAFIQGSVRALAFLRPRHLEEWAKVGHKLFRNTPESRLLCTKFFQLSPALFRYLGVDDIQRLVRFVDVLGQWSTDAAIKSLTDCEPVLAKIEKQDRQAFLSLAAAIAEHSWQDVPAYLKAAPGALPRVSKNERKRFLFLAEKVAKRHRRGAMNYLIAGSMALSEIGSSDQNVVLQLFDEMLDASPGAALEFLQSSPSVLCKMGASQLTVWWNEGMSVLRENNEAGLAYFRLESSLGNELIEHLSAGVDLTQISEILRMYCMALAGKSLQILPTSDLVRKGIGWVSEERATTEGTAIYLPPSVEQYQTKEQNFGWYKVVATHQAGHVEFGSFDFSFQKDATRFPNKRKLVAEMRPSSAEALIEIERLFDLFPDRKLAHDIFTVAEDCRVDNWLKREYAGIRPSYQRVQEAALALRRDSKELPLREVFLEVMIRLSMGNKGSIMVPKSFSAALRGANGIMRKLASPGATVEDAAEATIRLYDIAAAIPNVLAKDEEWEPYDPSSDQGEFDDSDMLEILQSMGAEGSSFLEGLQGENLEEMEYEAPQPVDYRGDFKPELSQLLMKLRAGDPSDASGKPMTPISMEMLLKQLAEKSVEIEVSDLVLSDLRKSADMFLSNVQKEAKDVDFMEQFLKQLAQQDAAADEARGSLDAEEGVSFAYDEWDYRTNDYRPRWCLIREKTMEGGDPDFFEHILKRNSTLASQIKRQFEMLNPELSRKTKKLLDGEEYELDAVIESVIEKRAGLTPNDKIYWRRNKIERDVAVVFLLDMSASTAEDIDKNKKADDMWFDDPRQYLAALRARRERETSLERRKRIIDVEKE